jgi:hypothetical protein
MGGVSVGVRVTHLSLGGSGGVRWSGLPSGCPPDQAKQQRVVLHLGVQQWTHIIRLVQSGLHFGGIPGSDGSSKQSGFAHGEKLFACFVWVSL